MIVLCECGCNLPAPISPYTCVRLGYVKGKPRRFRRGHKRSAEWAVEDCGYSTPCWLWRGTTDLDGYGRRTVGGKSMAAHRVAYERAVGPIPAGAIVHHRCGVRLCVNPDHLEALTPSAHSRLHHSKLSDAEFKDIRASSDPHRVIAARYGIGKTTVSRIKRQ